jgi:Fic family protein
LAKIVEIIIKLEYATEFKRDILLHRENRVQAIYSSLAIEGNALTLGEVSAVIDGKIVSGKQADIKEVKNAYEAYDKIMTFNPYATEDFLKAHRLMTEELIKESGKFRGGDVAVHIGASPQFISALIKDLFDWAKESELHPVLKSAIMHFEIEIIHPFADGNGRMGRLWQILVLAKWNSIFAWIPMETVLYQNRSQYYQAIEAARIANDSGAFIEFTLWALYDTILTQEKYQIDRKNKQESGINRDVDKKLIMDYIRKNSEKGTKFRELEQVLPSHSRNQIKVLVRELQQSELIYVVGKTSAARWLAR